jgi:hypothetical protein
MRDDDAACSILMTVRALKLTRYAIRVAAQYEEREDIRCDLEVAEKQVSEIIESPCETSEQHAAMAYEAASGGRKDN